MFKNLIARYKQEDKKMIEEAVRVSRSITPQKTRWLIVVFWIAVVIVSAILLLLLSAARSNATSVAGTCELPPGLAAKLREKYPSTHVVSFDDLDKYDRRLFQQLHGKQCPGVAKVNFYGDGKPTWAVVLISGDNPKRRAELLVARQSGAVWDLRTLDVTDGTPVVWREPPGTYEGMEAKKTLAKNSVIAFAGLESWEVVYIWTGYKAEKVQISD